MWVKIFHKPILRAHERWWLYNLTSEWFVMCSISRLCSSVVTLLSRGAGYTKKNTERSEIWLVENCWFWDTTVCKDCTLFFALLTYCVRAVSFEYMVEYWFLSVDTCWCSFDCVPWIALSFVWTSCKSLEKVSEAYVDFQGQKKLENG